MIPEMTTKVLRDRIFKMAEGCAGDKLEVGKSKGSIIIVTKGLHVDLAIKFQFDSKGSFSDDFGGHYGIGVNAMAVNGISMPNEMETMVQYASMFTDDEVNEFYSIYSEVDHERVKVIMPYGRDYVRRQYWTYRYPEFKVQVQHQEAFIRQEIGDR